MRKQLTKMSSKKVVRKKTLLKTAGVAVLSGLFVFAAAQSGNAMNLSPSITYNLGKLGTYNLSGGAALYGIISNMGAPTNGTQQHTAVSIGDQSLTVSKTSGWLQFNVTEVLGQTPSLAGTTDLRPYGSSQNPINGASVLNTAEITLAPSWSHGFTLSAGRLAGLEGVEVDTEDWQMVTAFTSPNDQLQQGNTQGIDVGYTNPSGSLTVNVQWNNGNNTNKYNGITAAASYVMNSYVTFTAYGNTLLSKDNLSIPSYNNPGSFNYITNNMNLVGLEAALSYGNYTATPYVQALWVANPDKGTLKGGDFYAFAATLPVLYQFNQHWSLGGQVAYATSNDPSWTTAANSPYAGEASSIYGIGGNGASMVGASIAPGWQDSNLFARVSLGINHLMKFQQGQAYGATGNHRTILKALGEVGFVF